MNYQNKFSKVFGMIFGIMGLVFFVVGVISLCNYLFVSNDADLLILGGIFSIIGGIFIIVGACSLTISYKQKRKAERLMREGICYDADIIRINENFYVHMNYRHPFIVECGYKDNHGKTYLVKSGNVWLNRFMTKDSEIKAKVWVNRNNPKDYYVDVYWGLDNGNPDMKFDYDYR